MEGYCQNKKCGKELTRKWTRIYCSKKCQTEDYKSVSEPDELQDTVNDLLE